MIDSPDLAPIVVKPPRRLLVRVVDGVKEPVKGADVVILGGYYPVAVGTTAADGTWTGAVPADATSWTCLARKLNVGCDYRMAERSFRQRLLDPLPCEVALTLDGTHAPIRVRAVDLAGRPLGGVKFALTSLQIAGRENGPQLSGVVDLAASTDPAGLAVFDWLPERVVSGFRLTSRTPDHAMVKNGLLIKAGAANAEVTVAHAPLERVAGRVVDRSGAAVEGALVAATGLNGAGKSFGCEVATDAAGRYVFRADSEMDYVLTATKAGLATPVRGDVVLRAGHPLDGVDLVLEPAIRVHGRVTAGSAHQPAAGQAITVLINRRPIPLEIQRPGAKTVPSLEVRRWVTTDAAGRYELLLGPGDYVLRDVPGVEPIRLAVPSGSADLVRDIAMPRLEHTPFRLVVVDWAGRPVSEATIGGTYIALKGYFSFNPQIADAAGIAAFDRSPELMVVHARSADRSVAGVARFDAEAAEGKLTLGPTATAEGRLVDPSGQPIPGLKFEYGIRISQSPARNSAFAFYFGGTATSDAEGRFTCPGLVPGQAYDIHVQPDGTNFGRSVPDSFRPTAPGPLAVGDQTLDLAPPRPYIPPTATERAKESFEAARKAAVASRLRGLRSEAHREYTRPLVLFGGLGDPTSVELFRLFNDTGDADKARPRTPADLRWEFELESLDLAQPEV